MPFELQEDPDSNGGFEYLEATKAVTDASLDEAVLDEVEGLMGSVAHCSDAGVIGPDHVPFQYDIWPVVH